jgi:hypothetical protein
MADFGIDAGPVPANIAERDFIVIEVGEQSGR